MVNTTTIHENWDRVREKVRQEWPQLQEKDLQEFSGNVEELVKCIQQKTGASRDSILSFLQTASEGGAVAVNRVREKVGETVSGARESLGYAAEQAHHGYQQVQTRVGETVQERPAMSLGAAFGLGVLVGVGLSMLFVDYETESMPRRYARQAEEFGRKFWDSIIQSLPDTLSRRA